MNDAKSQGAGKIVRAGASEFENLHEIIRKARKNLDQNAWDFIAAGGETAIVRMLELIEDEVQRSLSLLGVNTFAELDRSYIHPAAPTTSPDVLSAFSLLKI